MINQWINFIHTHTHSHPSLNVYISHVNKAALKSLYWVITGVSWEYIPTLL